MTTNDNACHTDIIEMKYSTITLLVIYQFNDSMHTHAQHTLHTR